MPAISPDKPITIGHADGFGVFRDADGVLACSWCASAALVSIEVLVRQVDTDAIGRDHFTACVTHLWELGKLLLELARDAPELVGPVPHV